MDTALTRGEKKQNKSKVSGHGGDSDVMVGSLDPLGGKIRTYLPKDEAVEGDTHGPQVQRLSGCTGSVRLTHAVVADT